MLQPGAPRDRAARDLGARRRRPHSSDAHRRGACARPRRKSTRSARKRASRPCSTSACIACIPSSCKQLGRLKFRQSYAQNVLLHSSRGRLPRGPDRGRARRQRQARAPRAGLLHDIGKAARSRAGRPARRGRCAARAQARRVAEGVSGDRVAPRRRDRWHPAAGATRSHRRRGELRCRRHDPVRGASNSRRTSSDSTISRQSASGSAASSARTRCRPVARSASW